MYQRDLLQHNTSKNEWPWSINSTKIDNNFDEEIVWPRISIITPSFNQAQFLEETIRSVLLQGYPNLEYIIIDGGSTDGSVEIIKKYEPWLAYWVSEKDKGQSHAINKGFERCTGDIFAWINSDDYYLSNAFITVANAIKDHDWVVGGSKHIEEDGKLINFASAQGPELKKFDKCFKNGNSFDFRIAQPSHFWSKRIIEDVGQLNEKLHFGMDFEWMLKALAKGYHPTTIDELVVCMRYHNASKTMTQIYKFDLERSKTFLLLGINRELNFSPSFQLARFYFSRGLQRIGNTFSSKGRKITSFLIYIIAWLITTKKVGGDYFSRVKNALK